MNIIDTSIWAVFAFFYGAILKMAIGPYMTWILENWAEISGTAAAVWAAISAVVALTPSDKDDRWLAKVLERVSILTSKDSPGTLKLPLSRMPEEEE